MHSGTGRRILMEICDVERASGASESLRGFWADLILAIYPLLDLLWNWLRIVRAVYL